MNAGRTAVVLLMMLVAKAAAAQEHPRPSVYAHPPELVPILFVLVDHQAHGRVRAHIRDSTKFVRGLGLPVDRGHDLIALEREADRYQVRTTRRVDGG